MLSAVLRLKPAAVLVIAVIASGGGVASESPSQIVAAAKAAVIGVRTVHVAGALSSNGTRITLDLDLENGKGGMGSMSEDGLTFKIIGLGDKVYISAGTAFWSHFGGKAAAEQLAGKWLVSPETGELGAFASLTNVRTLFSAMLSSHGTLAKGATSTLDGERVIAVRDTTKTGTPTLYVAATGKPYPVAIVKTGADGGRIDFSRFNRPVTITAPPHAIEFPQSK